MLEPGPPQEDWQIMLLVAVVVFAAFLLAIFGAVNTQ